MVETWALRIAEAIKRAEPERTASVAVLKFSLEAIINAAITISVIGIIGLVTNSFWQTMMAVGAFAVLRFFSGGLHLREALHCSLLSITLISIAPHLILSDPFIFLVNIISLLLIVIFAPSNIEGHARIPKKYFPILKLISALIIASNFLINSSTVALVFLFQAASTVKLKKEVIK
ncbi:accessory gene regulator ArgB-like protein [Cohnella cellulosilytica]|uniref:Accessory gene regulator ArgB-like protein n=1 Tax=Cohnella cellulosilytica TaxID=986710 RepID=A0ABW2F6A8_9BACL